MEDLNEETEEVSPLEVDNGEPFEDTGSYDEPEEYKVFSSGDIIIHPTFGEGTVITLSTNGFLVGGFSGAKRSVKLSDCSHA